MKRKIKLSRIKLSLETEFPIVSVLKGYSTIALSANNNKEEKINIILILNLKTNNIIYTNTLKSTKIINWIDKLRLNKCKVLNDLD